MNAFRTTALTLLTAGALAAGAASPPPQTAERGQNAIPRLRGLSVFPPTGRLPDAALRRTVELAICLDTSGSMNGLIEAAKLKLWDIVNDLALATPTPRLRVALLTFGNDGHVAEDGWVRVDSPFTEDLDEISRQLFALRTNGGTEFVGRVLREAGEQLEWTASDHALKLVVVAGNESADQDQTFRYADVCKGLISRGIMVNAIYCGNPADEIAPGWREVALLADGHYAAIDHNNGNIVIASPFDDKLAELSSAINTTYLAYGEKGAWGAANQVQQDANAQTLSSAVVAARCSTKGGVLYSNEHWDLVDACKQESFKLADVKDEDLPESMRGKTLEQKQAIIAEMAGKREAIQKEIADYGAKRQAYVNEEMKKHQSDADRSFDAALRQAIRAQAMSKGFEFKVQPPVNEAGPIAFVQRGDWWVDASYVDEYDALAAKSERPTFDETVPNTPAGREALLARLSESQRKAAQAIIDQMLMLSYWGGGLIVRLDGKLICLTFDC